MGIYVMITVDLICDHCQRFIGKLHTSKTDIPTYANANMTCSDCLDKGIEAPEGSTGADITDFVNNARKEE